MFSTFLLICWPCHVDGRPPQSYTQLPKRVERTAKVMLLSSALLPPPASTVYFSQCGQDWIVERLFAFNKRNFYVDLAANDAVMLSNTYRLDRIDGWRGICIEANPQYWQGLSVHRSCQLAGVVVTDRDDQFATFSSGNGAFGGIVGAQFDNKHASAGGKPLATLSLHTILQQLDAPRVIQYLNLDVEGAEWLVMHNFSFRSYRFQAIGVERPSAALRALFIENRYVRLQPPCCDEFWVHRDFAKKRFGGDDSASLPHLRELFRGFTGKMCGLDFDDGFIDDRLAADVPRANQS